MSHKRSRFQCDTNLKCVKLDRGWETARVRRDGVEMRGTDNALVLYSFPNVEELNVGE
ncbi:hypothetical protein PM082_019723 [Marasmius tenuissimus]|nr:hypothetical protein PM082_019723 [Marasmius tenuissimus]